jgi:hypothetical protein
MRILSDEVISAGDNTGTPTTATIDSLEGSIDDQAWLLGGQVITSGIGTVLLCTADDKQVLEYNYITPTDNGTTLLWGVETKDIDGVNRDLIIDWIEFEVGAVFALFQYSPDSGASWVTVGTSIANADFGPIRKHVNDTAGKFRFRVVGTGGGGQIGKLSFKFKEAFVVP